MLIKSSAPAPVAPAPPAPVPASSPDALAPPEDFLLADLLAPRPGETCCLPLQKEPSIRLFLLSRSPTCLPPGLVSPGRALLLRLLAGPA